MKPEDMDVLNLDRKQLLEHIIMCHNDLRSIRENCYTGSEVEEIFKKCMKESWDKKHEEIPKVIKNKIKMILKKLFRFKSDVNMNDDMVRVTLDMSKLEYKKLNSIYSFKDELPEEYWKYHHRDCGTKYRGCHPTKCPKNQYEELGIWKTEW